jgi:DNA (cytosine-5)-methyltransferase 1
VKVTEPPGSVLEGFAGPGGWSTGLAMLPIHARTVGVEWDTAACKTAHAAGHTRVRADVARFDLTAFAGLVWLLIMSPPCQAWSRSGKRKGILDQEAIFRHAMRVTTAGEWIDYADAGPLPAGEGDEGGTWHDARSPLVLEVLRWVLAVRPANICLEQVPDVLPFWELIARWLRGRGYSVWVGCLSSERYGVAQTRERAILIASRERAVSAPPATHTAYDPTLPADGRWHGAHDDLFGNAALEPWITMAEGAGWPPGTVVNTRGKRKTSGGNEFSADRPSWALTEKVRSWVYRRPATTIQGDPRVAAPGHRDRAGGVRQFEGESVRVTVEEAAALQSFPPGYPWKGTQSARHRQIGDAVPPLLAAHVLAACLGVQVAAAEEAA